MEHEQRLAPVSALASEVVESPSGQTIGFIKDFMVDMHDGSIAYVILSYGGLFGIGARAVPVPWGLFERRGRRYVVRLEKEILQYVPGIDDNGNVRALDAIWARHLANPNPVNQVRS